MNPSPTSLSNSVTSRAYSSAVRSATVARRQWWRRSSVHPAIAGPGRSTTKSSARPFTAFRRSASAEEPDHRLGVSYIESEQHEVSVYLTAGRRFRSSASNPKSIPTRVLSGCGDTRRLGSNGEPARRRQAGPSALGKRTMRSKLSRGDTRLLSAGPCLPPVRQRLATPTQAVSPLLSSPHSLSGFWPPSSDEVSTGSAIASAQG